MRKGVITNFAKFTGKRLCQRRRLWYRCFPVNSTKFLGTLFLQNTSVGCFYRELVWYTINRNVQIQTFRKSFAEFLFFEGALFLRISIMLFCFMIGTISFQRKLLLWPQVPFNKLLLSEIRFLNWNINSKIIIVILGTPWFEANMWFIWNFCKKRSVKVVVQRYST